MVSKPERPKKSLEIHIDREICIGASACVAAAGKTFVLDPLGKSTVLDPLGDSEASIQQAALACPTGAIILKKSLD